MQYLLVAHSEKLMCLRFFLERYSHMIILIAYAPKLAATEETKDELHASLSAVLQTVEQGDKLVVMVDYNVREGCDYMI